MLQSSVDLLLLWSDSDFLASSASLPEALSLSSWRSHASASNSANHFRNATNSVAVKLRTSFSMFSILFIPTSVDDFVDERTTGFNLFQQARGHSPQMVQSKALEIRTFPHVSITRPHLIRE